MAKKKEKVVKTGVDEWMATYSDMVTLLLCFFVLLYAASTPDETKFQYIFQSFNSVGTFINPFIFEENNPGESQTDNDGNTDIPPNSGEGTTDNSEDSIGLPKNYDDLFSWLSATVESSDYSDSIDVSQDSSSQIHIRLNNAIMFEGDSAVLLKSGMEALKEITPGIKAIGDYIKTIRVQGHTAKGLSAINDWDLSSARACSVTKFLDFQVIVDSEKYIAEGRGPYDPIADNDTEEGRQENRRVELIITRNELAVSDSAIIQDILQYDYGIMHGESGIIDRPGNNGGASSDTIQQIIDSLDGKYESNTPSGGDGNSDYTGPVFSKPITGIPDSILSEVESEETEEKSE